MSLSVGFLLVTDLDLAIYREDDLCSPIYEQMLSGILLVQGTFSPRLLNWPGRMRRRTKSLGVFVSRSNTVSQTGRV